jgi:hypothetical protein
MKSVISIAMLMGLAATATAAIASNGVGDFALIDTQGDFHKMSYYDNYKAIALLVQGNGKNAEQSLAAFKDAQTKHKENVKFFVLNPGTGPRATAQEQAKQYGDLRVLVDDTQLVYEVLGVQKTNEVFLLDQQSLAIVYRGPADEPLNKAIDEVLAGQPVSKPRISVKGDKVVSAKSVNSKSVSYETDIAPILADNCARCHRTGGVAPFAMNSHSIVQGFAPMIREVVMTKRMPPGQIDPSIGHFKNGHFLTAQQIQKLVHWINAGAKKDGATDPLSELKWPESKWTLGNPDAVIKVPPQSIPANGVLALIDVNVPIDGMDRDRYVRASEYVPSDRSVLHHTVTSVLPPNYADNATGLFASYESGARIVAYTPGAEPLVEPANTGGLLKKGSMLKLNLHYTTNGKATTDAGEIGLWFYPDDQVPTETMSLQCACTLAGWKTIPAYAANHEMQRTVTLTKDARLYSMGPHMHFRGKRMRFYADYPDGRHEELLNVANYQYNWQFQYELTQPKLMPAGTKITAVAAFDNSPQNKANPDPSRRVPFGEQSWDEMMFGVISVKYVPTSESQQANR